MINKDKRSRNTWKINKNRKILVFNSDFSGRRCNKPNRCDGWVSTGLYQTEVKSDGKHVLHMQVTIKAPHMLEAGKIKQTWAISTSEKANNSSDTSEVFSCTWNTSAGLPKDVKSWDCTSGIV